jgi:hypothetical protein
MVKILCAAIHFMDNNEYEHQPRNITSGFVITGWRHHNCFATYMIMKGKPETRPQHIQGFLTNEGNFVDRKEAAKIVFEAQQI